MKKLLLSLIALCSMTAASAQVFSKVAVTEGVTTLHVTKDCATLQSEYADGANGAWGVGMKWPAGYDMYTDAELSVTPYTDYAYGLDQWGKESLVVAITGNKMYINCGSTLAGPGSGSGFDESILVSGPNQIYGGDSKSNGILKVTVKADGVLGFKAFAGNNNRSMGLYTLATAEEVAAGKKIISDADNNDALSDEEYDAEVARGNRMKAGRIIAWKNFKKSITDAPETADEHNVASTEESRDVFGQVEAGREYLLLCSDVANHNLYEISFEAGATLAINGIQDSAKPVSNAVYNLAGQKVGADYKGIVIKAGRKIMQ